jgi:large subunit ribosomal protein L7/L12
MLSPPFVRRRPPRPEKTAVVRELGAVLRQSTMVASLDYRGLTAAELTDLRRRVGAVRGHVLVTKNTMINLAVNYTVGVYPVVPFPAVGPTALVFTAHDPVPVLHAVHAFAREHKVCALRGVRVDNWYGIDDAIDWFVSLGTFHDQLAVTSALIAAPFADTVRAVDGLIALRSDPTFQESAVTTSLHTLDDLLHAFQHLNLADLAEFNARFREKFGVVDAPVASAAPAADAPAEVEEQAEFQVELKAVGPTKIQVIKLVREERRDLGLKEAKELVESVPARLLTDVDRATADALRQKLEALGAVVTVR